MTSIKKLALRGAIWTIAGYGAGQLIRLVSNPILASFLDPSVLGLNSLMSVFIMGLALFSDVGLGPSIIQNKHGDEPAFYNTAWTMQIIRAFLLWMGCIAIAYPVYTLYSSEPHADLIIVLLPIIGFSLFLSGFESTAVFTLNRHMETAKINLFGLFNQLVSTGIVLTWSFLTRDIWALVLSGVATQTISVLVSHRLIPSIKNRFCLGSRCRQGNLLLW
jgi:O-antigen/teichoic acid export membrane protein